MSNDDKSSNNVELENLGRRKFFGKTALLGAGAVAVRTLRERARKDVPIPRRLGRVRRVPRSTRS